MTKTRPVREFFGTPWMFDLDGVIIGLEGRMVEDANDWVSDQNGDGRIYPYQLRIYRDLSGVRCPWYVVDETGWNGHEKEPSKLISRHMTYEAARDRRDQLMRKARRVSSPA